MWWLIPLGVCAAITAIVGALSDEEKRERERWENCREDVENDIEWHKQNIKEHLSDAEESCNFVLLVDIHYSSMRVANAAHDMLNSAWESLNSVSRSIVSAGEERDRMKQEKVNVNTREEKVKLSTEIGELIEFRNKLFLEKDTIKLERDNFLSKANALNLQTEKLKYAIRDNTGTRGEEWYSRLEERTRLRREENDE